MDVGLGSSLLRGANQLALASTLRGTRSHLPVQIFFLRLFGLGVANVPWKAQTSAECGTVPDNVVLFKLPKFQRLCRCVLGRFHDNQQRSGPRR